ncbi:protein LSM12 homolog [Gigantopelta aegis]|uniref:protein LSM12 homolog n=1 Tax=Gigantopelta aegis TaxID=1735272 RepID=UPI001B88E204|nr:protein LSM12 homolog [Gigantopelta aegis]
MLIMDDDAYLTFSTGSTVSLVTCHKNELSGEVLAFDKATKVLAIKIPASSGKHNLYDVRLVNLQYVSDIKVISEPEGQAPPLTSLNMTRIKSRVRQSLDEKRKQINYVGVGVPEEGQRLFWAIVKTINDVRWDGQKIIVMDEVTIQPPYKVENCISQSNESGRALDHVKKIVDKFLQDEAKRGVDRGSISPSPAPSSPSPASSS